MRTRCLNGFSVTDVCGKVNVFSPPIIHSRGNTFFKRPHQHLVTFTRHLDLNTFTNTQTHSRNKTPHTWHLSTYIDSPGQITLHVYPIPAALCQSCNKHKSVGVVLLNQHQRCRSFIVGSGILFYLPAHQVYPYHPARFAPCSVFFRKSSTEYIYILWCKLPNLNCVHSRSLVFNRIESHTKQHTKYYMFFVHKVDMINHIA